MSLVLDCSVTLSWYLPDEHDDGSIAVADHVADNGAVVPFHWRAELANGLLPALRRGARAGHRPTKQNSQPCPTPRSSRTGVLK